MLCLLVRYKASTALGSTVTGSISRASNSNVSDDFLAKKAKDTENAGWVLTELLVQGKLLKIIKTRKLL